MAGISHINILTALGEGKTLKDFATDLTDVIAAVRRTGKKGKVTLEVQVTNEEALDDGSNRLGIAAAVKASVPRPTRPVSRFYVNPAGVISTRDPRQPELPGIASDAPRPAAANE